MKIFTQKQYEDHVKKLEHKWHKDKMFEDNVYDLADDLYKLTDKVKELEQKIDSLTHTGE